MISGYTILREVAVYNILIPQLLLQLVRLQALAPL